MVAVIDFFAGAGGLTTGFQNAGCECIAAVDINKNACATLKTNHPGMVVIHKDIKDVTEADLVPLVPKGGTLVICAGIPCQGISLAGKTPNTPDVTDYLYKEVIKLGKKLGAAVILFENVGNILRKPSVTGKTLLDDIVEELEDNGYHVIFKKLNAVDFEVPQKRERVFIAAFRSVEAMNKFEWPTPVEGFDPRYKTIMQDEYGIDAAYEKYGYDVIMSPEKTKYYLERQRERPQYVGIFNRNNIPRTLRAGYMKSRGAEALFWTKEHHLRMMTIPECMRIQTFPDTYEFVGPPGSIYQQIGNAVPVKLATHVAVSLVKCFLTENDKFLKVIKAIKKTKKTIKVRENRENRENRDDEVDYEVDYIVDHKTTRNGTRFLIKWRGYDSKHNSWEPESNMSCPEKLVAYWSSQNKS